MDKAKRAKISQQKYRTGKAIWTNLEKEWEEENRSASTSATIPNPECENQPDAPDVSYTEEWLEDDEDVDAYLQLSDDSDFEDQDEYMDDDRAHKNQIFVDTMRSWALKHQISHVALNEFLEAIRNTTDFYVPKDSRTFLKTPVGVGKEIEAVAGGQMWYKGIEKNLLQYYRAIPPTTDSLTLDLFMDGIPLHNAGPTQFWPILMQLHDVSDAPIMTLGIFCGACKPDNTEDYLGSLVEELNNVQDNGVVINGTRISIKLRAIIADAPARSFIKDVAGHNSINACMKCKIKGKSYQRRMIFEGTAEPRTDAEFRSGAYVLGHQKRPSPLLRIKNFDIVKDVPTSEDMHLVYLGCVKKIVSGLVTGSLLYEKLSLDEQDEMSGILVDIKLPVEFKRAVRSLKYVKYWKASEFRTFLLHISVPVLKGRVTDRAYHHFKLLVVAITMFSSIVFKKFWDYAGSLLNQFVDEFSTVYDRRFLSYNIHNLLHMKDDVKRLGPLPKFSAFPYEDKLQHVKRLVRTGNNCLSQVVGRLGELSEIESSIAKTQVNYPFLKFRQGEVILHIRSNFELRQGNRNGWFLTKNNDIVRYSRAIEASGSFIIEGHQILRKKPAFTYPCNSEIVFKYIASVEDLSPQEIQVNVRDVKCKFVAVTLDGGITFTFSPLMHTFEE